MKRPATRRFSLGLGLGVLAVAMLAWTPAAEAQFFWSPWFQEQPRARPKPRVKAAPRPGDDLPPIVPKESSIPPPPDDRPYDGKLLRLAEILGAVHYLRELCGAQEGQLWREQMKEIVKNEGSTAVRRAKLVNSFNDGYRGYRRTYRACTDSATLAITRFSAEGAQIAQALAKPSHYASRNAPAEQAASPEGTEQSAPVPNADGAAEPAADANAVNNPEPNAGQPDGAAPSVSEPSQDAAAPPAANPPAAAPGEANLGETNPGAANPVEEPKPERRKVKRAAKPVEAAKPPEASDLQSHINR